MHCNGGSNDIEDNQQRWAEQFYYELLALQVSREVAAAERDRYLQLLRSEAVDPFSLEGDSGVTANAQEWASPEEAAADFVQANPVAAVDQLQINAWDVFYMWLRFLKMFLVVVLIRELLEGALSWQLQITIKNLFAIPFAMILAASGVLGNYLWRRYGPIHSVWALPVALVGAAMTIQGPIWIWGNDGTREVLGTVSTPLFVLLAVAILVVLSRWAVKNSKQTDKYHAELALRGCGEEQKDNTAWCAALRRELLANHWFSAGMVKTQMREIEGHLQELQRLTPTVKAYQEFGCATAFAAQLAAQNKPAQIRKALLACIGYGILTVLFAVTTVMAILEGQLTNGYGLGGAVTLIEGLLTLLFAVCAYSYGQEWWRIKYAQ